MDVSETILANSSQVNAEDLLGGSITVTITGVEKGTTEQPVFIHLAEFEGRTFRPAKTVRRLLVAAWGSDSSTYIGRQLTIFNDPHVKWAGQEVGGVRVSHMSHLKAPLTVSLTTARGKRAPFTVEPIPATHLASQGQVDAALAATRKATTVTDLDKIWDHAKQLGIHHELAYAIDERRTELEAGA